MILKKIRKALDKIAMPNNSVRNNKPWHRYSDSYNVYERTGTVTEKMIAEYVKKHTHWWDRLDYHFVSDCALLTEDILAGYLKPKKEGAWYFGRLMYFHWVEDEEWKHMGKERQTEYIQKYLRS